MKIQTSNDGWYIPVSCSNTRFEGPDSSYGGFAFNEEPDSFRCQLNYNVVLGDTAYLLVAFKRFGITRTMNLYPLTGQTNSQEEFTFDLYKLPPHPAGNYDSLVIGLYTSHPFKPGSIYGHSYVMLDDLHFYSWSQPPNSSFENWGPGDKTSNPTNWYNANNLYTSYGLKPYARRDSSLNGSASLCLYGPATPTNNFFTPHVTLDSLYWYRPFNVSGMPLTFKPDSLCFDYLYETQDSSLCLDPAFLAVTFYKGGGLYQENIFQIPCNGGVLESMKLDFNLNQQPDYVDIVISPFHLEYANKENYRFCIDDLSFFCNGIGISDFDELDDYIFPNPSSTICTAPEWVESVLLINAAGQEVRSSPTNEISVRGLSPGIYTLVGFSATEKNTSYRLIVTAE